MAEDRTSVPIIALSPKEARFVTRPPLPAGLRAEGGSREDYEYNKVR